jgi:hypothetical protein
VYNLNCITTTLRVQRWKEIASVGMVTLSLQRHCTTLVVYKWLSVLYPGNEIEWGRSRVVIKKLSFRFMALVSHTVTVTVTVTVSFKDITPP